MRIKTDRGFDNGMGRKIADQESAIEQGMARLSLGAAKGADEESTIGRFYWDRQDLSTCGSSAGFTSPQSFPLLPQLLMTPKLIVDLVPMSRPAFEHQYGVTVDQMKWLVDHGFVIPNIYHFMTRHEYRDFRYIWPIVLHPASRINSLWITRYLDTRHTFEQAKADATNFFSSQINKLNKEEGDAILRIERNIVPSLENAASVLGHRMAYLRTIGKSIGPAERLIEVVSAKWETPGLRVEALELLRSAQAMLVGRLTGAFGGCAHMDPDFYEDILKKAGAVGQILSPRTAGEIMDDLKARTELRGKAEFCMNVAARLRRLSSGTGRDKGPAVIAKAFPLNRKDFSVYKKILSEEVVREGYMAKWAETMRIEVIERGAEPDLVTYRALLDEIDSMLHPLPVLGRFLRCMSRLFELWEDVHEEGPPSDAETCGLQWLFFELACWSRFLARSVEKTEFVPLFVSWRKRILCAQWRRIRRTLQPNRKRRPR